MDSIQLKELVDKSKGLLTTTHFDSRGIVVTTWDQTTVPNELRVKPTDIGARVWVAENERAARTRLVSYKEPGTPMYKDGGVVVDSGYGYNQSFDLDSVIIHPDIFVEKLQAEKNKNKQQKKKAQMEKKTTKKQTDKIVTKKPRATKNRREHFENVIVVELNR